MLCSDGSLSYKDVADDVDVDHKRLIGSENQRIVDKIYSIQTLNNYMKRLKNWLKRFNGVGTT